MGLLAEAAPAGEVQLVTAAPAAVEGEVLGNSIHSGPRVRFRGIGWGFVLALSACSGGGRSSGTSPGDISYAVAPEGAVVSSVSMAAPEDEEFILQATMPVPPGTYRAGDPLVPFSVIQPNGRVAPTQVEVVTRYPDDDDGADVVELIARVTRPPGAEAGDRISYDVAYDPHPRQNFSFKPNVRALFATPGALRLRTWDVFGNSYTADLFRDVREQTGEQSRMRNGQLMREFRTHEILLPDSPHGGADGTMPHMMAAHAFITHYARADYFSVDLHIHNGMSGYSQDTDVDDALNEIYFKELDLVVPQGWHVLQAFDDPMRGSVRTQDGWRIYPLVKKFGSGKMHVMPRQSHFWRRLVVTRITAQEEARTVLRKENLAFCQPGVTPTGTENYSWWNAETARYYPQSHRLPSLAHVGNEVLRARLKTDYRFYRDRVAEGTTGEYPFMSGNLGWAHPYGSQYGGDVGGQEIHLFDGIETAASASNDGYRMAQILARVYIDRQPTPLYNADGNPNKVEDWVHENGTYGSWVPMYFFLRPYLPDSDVFGFGDAPTFQTQYVHNNGLTPGYDSELAGYMPVDFQHYIRYTRNLKCLAWLGNDSLAKEELRMAAELFRLSFHEHRNSNYNHVQGSGLLSKIQRVSQFPGQGLEFGRGESWGMDAALAAYATGNDIFRGRYYPWFKKIADVLRDGQAECTGCIMAAYKDSLLGGQYRVRQSYETAISDNAIRGLTKTVFEGKNPNRTQDLENALTKSVYASISPTFWDSGASAPYQYVAVGPADASQPLFCEDVPADGRSTYVDRYQYWSSFAYAYELTGDEIFLTRAAQMQGGSDLLQEALDEGTGNLGNRAALLALLQTLNGMD